MNRSHLKTVFFRVIERMRRPYYQGVAAELAFFFLLSMVPLFFLFGQMLGLFSLSMDLVNNVLKEYISEEMGKSLREYMNYKPPGTLNLFFILFALWSASKAQYSMMQIANYSYTGMNTGRGFFKEKLRAMLLVVITIVLLGIGLSLLVYTEPLMRLFDLYVTRVMELPLPVTKVWYTLRWPIGIAIYFFAIGFINYTLPTKRISIKKIIPGSIFTSAGMLIATWIYSYYASNFSRWNILYGSLGTIIGLLLWFYILGYVLVVGIVINAVWQEE